MTLNDKPINYSKPRVNPKKIYHLSRDLRLAVNRSLSNRLWAWILRRHVSLRNVMGRARNWKVKNK